MRRTKLTVIGAGSVGAAIAHRLAEGQLGDIVLLDIAEAMARGKALDITHAAPLIHHDGSLVGASDFGETADSDIIIIAAGLARSEGMSRDDLQEVNATIVAECTDRAVKTSRDAMIIVVTNPLDVMCEVARRVSGFVRERVFGMGGVVDAARMRALVAGELGISSDSVFALVVGGHGDSMVPLPRYTTVSGVPLPELLPADRIDAIVRRTAQAGSEIIELLGTGSATVAPAAGVYEMVESIVKDRKKILPCSVFLQGEFGIADAFVGVPCTLGIKGMEGIFELKLTTDEKAQLARSAADVARQIAKLPEGLCKE